MAIFLSIPRLGIIIKEMQELNKTQLILLALLLSFVTSIATGIVTVTLLDQAPPGLTRTINRVVERTVERVVPGETKIIEQIREVQVGPTEEELVVGAIGAAKPALAKLLVPESFDPVALPKSRTAFFVTAEGAAVTVLSGLIIEKEYALVNSAGQSFQARVVFGDEANNIAFLKIIEATTTASSNSPLSRLAEAISADRFRLSYLEPKARDIVLGQTVISLGVGGSLGPTVSLGIISAFRAPATGTPALLYTNIEAGENNLGGPVLSLEGGLVGILSGPSLVSSGSKSVIVPSLTIRENLSGSGLISAQAGDNTATVFGSVDSRQ